MTVGPMARRVPISGRYPVDVAQAAHDYAIANRLSLTVLLSSALAEYLAKREQANADPAPQLHYRPGRPPLEAVRRQAELMRVDVRGRKLHPRSFCVTSLTNESSVGGEASRRRSMGHDATDGEDHRPASKDAAPLRAVTPHPSNVRHALGRAVALAG